MRRKFFAFISLFGVSFTLMILLVVMAMFDHLVGPGTPVKRVDRMLFVNGRHLGFVVRKRDVRPPPRSLHRCQNRPRGPLRAGQRRHHLS